MESHEYLPNQSTSPENIKSPQSAPNGPAISRGRAISRFEHVVTSHPPILESLLSQLPTASLFSLYFTSCFLRDYLTSYPLAWTNLSYRSPRAAASETPSPWAWSLSHGSDGSGSNRGPTFSLDKHLRSVLPVSILLTSLDLDNTNVDGLQLYANVVSPRRATLKHLSIRGCKQVSLKYHVLPFLEMELSLQESGPQALKHPLALKSLYIHRCRHHRRRAYRSSSLHGRDSDSKPTHAVIEICHILGVWTDTAWCPSPGPRCLRRVAYATSRNVPTNREVWVPFDRLWRSRNVIGSRTHCSPEVLDGAISEYHRGRLWEQQEIGFHGEAVGSSTSWPVGEGKDVPMHLRRSHRMFIDAFSCDGCGETIPERCEQCSIRMHCMGCRKTLCASCAYDIPMKKEKERIRSPSLSNDSSSVSEATNLTGRRRRALAQDWWWPKGVLRSPNSLQAGANENTESDDENGDLMNPIQPDDRVATLQTRWCCIQPTFSGSGSPVTHNNVYVRNLRASPLPKGLGFEDPAFSNSVHGECGHGDCILEKHPAEPPTQPLEDLSGGDIIQTLDHQKSVEEVANLTLISPRTLCRTCHESKSWKVFCAGCDGMLCYDHEVQMLKARRCGWKDLMSQRSRLQAQHTAAEAGVPVSREHMISTLGWFFSKWKPIVHELLTSPKVRAWNLRRTQDDARKILMGPALSGKTRHLCLGHFLRTRNKSSTTNLLTNSQPHSTQTSSISEPNSPDAATELLLPSSSWMTGPIPTNPPARRHRQRSSSLPPPPRESPAKPKPCTIYRAPAWTGCNRYYCPTPHNHLSNNRINCRSANINECADCGILVCKACALNDRIGSAQARNDTSSAANGESRIGSRRTRKRLKQDPRKPCSCSSCASVFRCPNCRRSKAVLDQCVYELEEGARQEQREERRRQERESRGDMADLIRMFRVDDRKQLEKREWGVAGLFEFWDSVMETAGVEEIYKQWLDDFQGLNDTELAMQEGTDNDDAVQAFADFWHMSWLMGY